MKISFDFEFAIWGIAFEAACTGTYAPGSPGQTYGPPESCYPPEGAEFDLQTVVINQANGNVVAIDVIDVTSFFNEFEDELYKLADDEYLAVLDAYESQEADRERDERICDDKHWAQMQDLEP